MKETSVLKSVNFPSDLKKCCVSSLPKLAGEIRQFIIEAISKTGGHLGASLGVVELTIGIHYVFDTPNDKLIWDIGHQSYAHKVLTGRKNRFHTIRTEGGLSGFCKKDESEYDYVDTGHSSTSISVALGAAVALNLKKQRNKVVAVIGDGAMSGGMAYEAINNAGHLKISNLIVILNDNKTSISPAVGALNNYLTNLISSKKYITAKDIVRKIVRKFPEIFHSGIDRIKDSIKGIAKGTNIFESLGFTYLGPIDGHNLKNLIPILKKIKETDFSKPILLHVITEKGRGYSPAQNAFDKFHGVLKFDLETGEQQKRELLSFTDVFARSLVFEAERDERILAITAGMTLGTGLNIFEKKFPKRFFDVGIAEQHAVTFASGLALEGFKPFCTIYSTFLQRSYDQIIQDVAIQKIPVRFAIDRAGFVGADGITHHGFYDIAFLRILPNIILMAPSNPIELISAIKTAIMIDDQPSALRFPKMETNLIEVPDFSKIEPLEVGIGKIIQNGEKNAIIFYGPVSQKVELISKRLEKETGKRPTIVNARFCKPLDEKLILEIAQNHKKIITIEEGGIGGFGSAVLEFLEKTFQVSKIEVEIICKPSNLT